MKALAIRRYGAPMEMMELSRPEPGPGEVLVRVRASRPRLALGTMHW
jgi:NADPH2:quinone reductase